MSDRLPRHQTSNTLLIFFQNRRASSPSSHHPSLCRSKMMNTTRTAVLSVNTQVCFCWSILGACVSKRCVLCSFAPQSAAVSWLAYKAVGMQLSTLSACTHCSSQLQIALAWNSSSTHETGFCAKLVACPFAFLVLATHRVCRCAEKDKLACKMFAQVLPP